MKILFVHQNFPGQFVHIAAHLVRRGHEVAAISTPSAASAAGVRRFFYNMPPDPHGEVPAPAREFARAMARAAAVAGVARKLSGLGYRPDVVVGHHGWGELLDLQDVWPQTPLLGYFEFYYRIYGLDAAFDPEFPIPEVLYPTVRARNAVNHLALTNPGAGQTPTRFQLDTYPDWAKEKITLLPEGVNLDVCRPNAARASQTIAGVRIAPQTQLITYVTRDLEPYRGFHVVMRALPAVLRARPQAVAILVGGDGVSYGAPIVGGSWREFMLAELGSTIDRERVHFPGRIDYADYVRLLQRSDAHLYFTYPFVASWSLREALACGCALVCSDTEPVREFVEHRHTGLLCPFLDPGAIADSVNKVLEGGATIRAMRRGARVWAQQRLSLDEYLQRYETLISDLIHARCS